MTEKKIEFHAPPCYKLTKTSSSRKKENQQIEHFKTKGICFLIN